jgi:hypothetical protein
MYDGRTQEEHDQRLRAVLQYLVSSGMTLNKQKCIFSVSKVKFLGQIIDSQGIHPDLNKIKAIEMMEAPKDVSGVRRLLGTVNQLGKFIPNLAEITHPIRDLLIKDNSWILGADQQEAFREIKKALTSTLVLAHFNPTTKP